MVIISNLPSVLSAVPARLGRLIFLVAEGSQCCCFWGLFLEFSFFRGVATCVMCFPGHHTVCVQFFMCTCCFALSSDWGDEFLLSHKCDFLCLCSMVPAMYLICVKCMGA